MTTNMPPWPGLVQYSNQMLFPGGKLFFYQNKNTATKNSPLVFIHGLGDEADTWRHILPRLEDYKFLAPDLPGFGRSIWHGKINISCHANTIIELISTTLNERKERDALNERKERNARIERSRNAHVVLIGSSMGAGIAELIAFKRPDLVKALVLMDGCFPITGSVSPQFLLAGLPFVGRNWYRGFRSNHEAAWKSLYAYYKNLDAMSAEDKQFLRARVIARVESDNQERGYFASLRSTNAVFMFRMKYYSQMIKNFKGKILLVWGEHDHVMPIGKASVFTNLRPDVELKFISGAGHLPHQEKPEETFNVLLDFLNNLD